MSSPSRCPDCGHRVGPRTTRDINKKGSIKPSKRPCHCACHQPKAQPEPAPDTLDVAA